MDINLELAIYKCYTLLLEQFCREQDSKVTMDVALHNLWITAVEYALDAFSEGKDKDDSQKDEDHSYH